MKKIKLISILIICLFVSNLKVYAASATLSVSSQNISVGDKFTISVKIRSAAAWNIHATSTGAVGKCEIKEVDATSDALDTSKTFSTTCTATEEGTINITLSGDVTSANDGNAVNISGNTSIKVNKKIINNNTNNNNTNNNNKSDNNKLKELVVENYNVKKIDNNNYELEVGKEITSVTIKATLEDSKAKISGTGEHELSIGENKIKLVVTSESGKRNNINIKIIRKDGYYLNDLSNLLNESETEEIDIIVSDNDKLSSEVIENIKRSQKKVNLSYYDESKRVIYSFKLDGDKINGSGDFTPVVSFDSDSKNKILEVSDYRDGIVVNFPNESISGIEFKLYVGNKYQNTDQLNIYNYIETEKKLSVMKNSISVNDGYIEFDLNENEDYFITMSHINSINNSNNNGDETNPVIFIIISIIELIIILLLVVIIFKRKNNNKNNVNNNENYNISNNINGQNSNIVNVNNGNTIINNDLNNNSNNNTNFF